MFSQGVEKGCIGVECVNGISNLWISENSFIYMVIGRFVHYHPLVLIKGNLFGVPAGQLGYVCGINKRHT